MIDNVGPYVYALVTGTMTYYVLKNTKKSRFFLTRGTFRGTTLEGTSLDPLQGGGPLLYQLF